jgi:hypothetical protein
MFELGYVFLRMDRSRKILGTMSLVLMSCGGAKATSTATDGSDAGASPGGPYRITCGFHYRASERVPLNEKREAVYFTDAPREENFDIPLENIPVRTSLTNAADDSSAVVLTIEFPRSQIRWRREDDGWRRDEHATSHDHALLNFLLQDFDRVFAA